MDFESNTATAFPSLGVSHSSFLSQHSFTSASQCFSSHYQCISNSGLVPIKRIKNFNGSVAERGGILMGEEVVKKGKKEEINKEVIISTNCWKYGNLKEVKDL